MKQLSVFLMLICGVLSTSFAQRTITGQIFDDAGKPLVGANVVVKGTTTGTISDFDGAYRLEVPEGVNALVVSFVGFNKQEVKIESSDRVNATLSKAGDLWEDVNKGLGVENDSRYVKITADDPEQPLFVVDGVLLNREQDDPLMSQDSTKSDLLNELDPEDIKEVSVLKGASAHAIYGSAARNGVIIITTKSGKGTVVPEK